MPNENDSVERRQKLVKEAEEAGKKSLKDTNLTENPLPKVDVVIKRAKGFLETLFKIQERGTLTLGTDNKDPLFIDGNNVKTEIAGGSFIDVSGTLVMNGGIIANGNNEKSGSAPIYVHQGGKFTMNGGRITSNKNISKGISDFNAAGGVYVDEGGEFTLKAGSIDNNHAPVGGVFLGRIFGNKSGDKIPAKFIMDGGFIARNIGPMFNDSQPDIQYYGGGVHVDSLANFVFNNGIIAGNVAYHGGGIAVTDNYVEDFDGVGKSKINKDNYDDYIKYAGACYTQKGGLIYKNLAKVSGDGNFTGAGGGIYINTSKASLKGGYLLENESENEGGGIYVSIAPYILKLDHVLISQNKAIDGKKYHHYAGNGGGYWNCPIGNVNFEDFNSVYIFDNESFSSGQDLAILGKNKFFIKQGLSQKYLEFLTRISPITEKGNIIKYLHDGKDVPEWMYNTKEGVYLKAIYDAKTKEEAWTNSKFFIMNNVALKGGGIGSNANITGSGEPGDYKIEIEKKWHESIPEAEKPDSIWVDLFIGEAKYGEIELKKSNGWAAKFRNLPFTNEQLNNMKIRYSIKEKNSDFYSIIDEQLGFNDKDELQFHLFLVKNYPYSEIPVVKKWDESIKEKDIPDSVKVFLLRDGKKVKDKDGKYRYIILSKDNGWKGNFDRLPYFELYGMGIEHYSIEEDSDIFIPLVRRQENSIISIEVRRLSNDKKYKIEKDYTGGLSRIDYIPFELHYIYKVGGKEETEVYKSQIKFYTHPLFGTTYDSAIMDVLINGSFSDSDIEVKTYYDENGNPFPRNLGKYQASWDKDDIVISDVPYILKLVEENGKPVLYVPKLTDSEDDYNLLRVIKNMKEGKEYIELTNYYQPKHRLEIEKKWEANDPNSIPESLRVKINGKYVDKEIVLSPEEWKYVEEFLGKGLLATNKYAFVEEDLVNFDGSQSIETSLEFSAEGKKVTFLDKDGKSISQEEFLKQIKGKKYSFELKEAAEDKAEVEIKYDKEGNLTIVYPVDVTITEVARVLFTNTERPPETPPGPNTRIIIVTKQWALEDGSKPADKVIVELYRDGKPTGKRMELSAANNWTGEFRDLEVASASDPTREYLYTIREVGEHNGSIQFDDKKFEVIYTGDMVSGFTITNKEVPPEEPPEEPETPPEEPPETPEKPPETPEVPPETPPVIPPKTPKTPPKKPGSPQTGVDGVSGAFALMTSAAAGLFVLRRKKKED